MENQALTLQMLEWLSAEQRSYPEAMEAWRTSCPRLTIWEDAVIAGLVEVQGSEVMVTKSGRALLNATNAKL